MNDELVSLVMGFVLPLCIVIENNVVGSLGIIGDQHPNRHIFIELLLSESQDIAPYIIIFFVLVVGNIGDLRQIIGVPSNSLLLFLS